MIVNFQSITSLSKINAKLTLVISETVHLLKLRVAETGYSSNWPVSKMNTPQLKIMKKKKRRKQKIRRAMDMFQK